MKRPNHARTALVAALLSTAPFVLGACASVIPPLGTSYEAQRGFKARTYVGTPEELHPIVVTTLGDLGFEVRADKGEIFYISGNQGMSAADPSNDSGRRSWTRVGVSIRQVDMHKRAPRTLIEVDAERMQGAADGPIEASVGTIPGSFYQDFFQALDGRVTEMTRQPVRGFLPPA